MPRGKKNILWPALAIALLYTPMQVNAPTQVHANTPLAVLVTCKGEVTVVRSNGKPIRGAFGLPLHAGDEVRTGARAEAEILFENNHMIQIGENSTSRVMGSRKPAGIQLAQSSFQSVQDFLTLTDDQGTMSLAALRAVDEVAAIRIESPAQTRIATSRPVFHWAGDPAEELRIKLEDENGALIWESIVTGTNEISYPDDVPELSAGGSYAWTLETTDPLRLEPVKTPAAFFEILSETETRNLENALAAVDTGNGTTGAFQHILRASILYRHGLLEAAIQETIAASRLDPENPRLASILTTLHTKIGRSR